jgi:hypothetical protein
MFARYLGIDYSGAETPTASLKGLRVYRADPAAPPTEVPPPPGPQKYWTRRGLATWLVEQLHDPVPTLVGLDHAFSFPLPYFERYQLPHDWPAFLDDFVQHWPTDEDSMYVRFIRDGIYGQGAARTGDPRWRRLTERRARTAKSVFRFDVQGQVATSTHAGLPWLRHLHRTCRGRVHFWPFDGWTVPVGSSVVVEVYPALWRRAFPITHGTPDQQDAYAVAAWMRTTDREDHLPTFFQPALTHEEHMYAQIEGWILGVL